MAAATNGGNPMVLAALLIGGAMLYSRSMTARAGVRPGTVGSMPGSAGTGTSQIVGGIVGSILQAFKGGSTGTKQWSVWNPINPDEGTSYNPANPAQPIAVQDLVKGTIADYYEGDRSSYAVPMTSDIFSDVAGTDTFAARPGSYWN